MIDVVEAQGGQGGVEGASPGHVVGYEEERVELLEAPELGHGAGRAAVAAGRDVHARHRRQRVAEVRRRAGAVLFVGHDRDHGRNGVGLLVQPLRRDLDVLRVRGGDARRGRRRGTRSRILGNRRRQEHEHRTVGQEHTGEPIGRIELLPEVVGDQLRSAPISSTSSLASTS